MLILCVLFGVYIYLKLLCFIQLRKYVIYTWGPNNVDATSANEKQHGSLMIDSCCIGSMHKTKQSSRNNSLQLEMLVDSPNDVVWLLSNLSFLLLSYADNLQYVCIGSLIHIWLIYSFWGRMLLKRPAFPGKLAKQMLLELHKG